MVEDVWEIGLRVEGGVFTKKGMVKSLELVLGHDQHGRRMREKIRDLKELIVKAAGPDEALEASCVPFLWSLRENFKAFLPNGFLERTRKQGKIVPWAPQAYVLSHKAVGVYITHCGYHSVFESIVGEVPMICRPVLGDNKMNGRMVEDVWEIGVRVEGGVLRKKGMVKSLELVLGHD
ncbi:hypothetical protein F2P56_022989 [Juglans regia]|uniref:Uncharacterized protein n=1 Tax=Juglans regia TaxID=51240 RepID=A0A833ULU8_JUGRE|nr:hypothetical protein F2P56_022989 [Juglans regia]